MKQERPFISIVIPTYNRQEQLAICLRACSRLDYPRDRFEVIVVDDGGTMPVDEVVNRFHALLTLKLLRQDNAGPATARNRGATEATGEFLAFTDDDCAPASNWLEALAAQFVASPDCAVGGQTRNALTHNLYSTASQLLISYLFSYYNAVPHEARFFPSSNLAFPAKRFRAIGGFDVTYPRAAGEDRELCDRWLHHGYRMVYAAQAAVYHAHDLTFWTFLRQHFNYGRGALSFHQVLARRGQRPVKVEPPVFYFNMLRYPFVSEQGFNALILMLLLVVTQVANTAGFFWERAKGTAA
jgi:cellulose synthase/poly-beta-1,6-N-acetylglucosamine synthase-like glycosyltransferase